MKVSGVLSTTTINRPGGGNGNPLQYSCLGNPMDRGGYQVTVHGKELAMTEHTHAQNLLLKDVI